MKTILHFCLTCLIFFVSLPQVFSSPLNGSYSVGPGGNFSSINTAVSVAVAQGINGPTKFRILSGTHNEFTIIPQIPGSSIVNTLTFESFVNDPDSTIISFSPYVFRLNGTSNIVIRKLTLGNIELRSICQNIKISENKFSNAGITQTDDLTLGLDISNNTGLSGLIFITQAFINQDFVIHDNTFNSPTGFISIFSCNNLEMENNKLNSLSLRFCDNVKLVRNRINFLELTQGGFELSFCKTGTVINNFITDNAHVFNISFRNDSNLFVTNNSFLSQSITQDTTISVFDNKDFIFKNNVVTNDAGNYLMSFNNNTNLTSIFNIYFNGNTNRLIVHNGTAYSDLATYQSSTGLDGGSIIRQIHFVDDEDLHLQGSSIGDPLLAGAPDPLVTNDIDGQPRNPLHPYRGADEADFPLPVELASFTSTVQNNNVILKWKTSFEQNNYGFEIERSSIKNNISENWIKVGFVNGNGTQTSAHDYSFKDNGLNSGKYNYRLKQIDFNGNFQFHELGSEVNIGLPQKFELSQNYPNPFNPSTTIGYNLPFDGKVSLKIFDMNGKEVLGVVNEIQTSGYYTIKFDATNFSSGVYYYKLTAGNFSDIKKMIVLK